MERSWLQAIKKYACTRFGYSTIRGIDGPVQQLELDDTMPKYIFYFLPSFSLSVNLFVQLVSS